MVGNWVAVSGPSAEPIAVGVISSAVRKLTGPEVIIENANKGYLGIRLADPEDQEGVLVNLVEPAGSAAKSGMKKGDIIYEIVGKPVKNRDNLLEIMEGYKPGDTITVRVRRGEEELALRVKLGQRSDFSRGDFQNSMGGQLSGRRTGFPAILQHDTVVRPTDCGGPLVDIEGRVLGINIARAGRVETWALPGNLIEPILKELKATAASPIGK
jgi:serine protease Do